VEKNESGIRVKRELEDGWFHHVEMPLPALLTIQSGISKLRYATLMGIKKAKSKEVKKLATADLGGYGRPVGPQGLDPEFVEQLTVFTSSGLEA